MTDNISDQHKAIASLVSRGYSNKMIARELGISMGWVKNLLTRIYKSNSIEGNGKRAKLAVIVTKNRRSHE